MSETGSSDQVNRSVSDQPPQLTAEQLLAYVAGAALFLMTLLAYLPALKAQFIWDDDMYVVNNSALRSFNGLRTIWLGIVPDPQAYRDTVVPQYYPMTLTSFWLEYRIWGANPFGYHIINVLLHATAALLIWTILRKLSVPGAWVIAAIFALHPLQVESVAWITERKNVLSAVFYLCSMLIYLRFCGLDPAPKIVDPDQTPLLPTEPWKLYLLSLVLFMCALLSKSVAGSMPAAMLLILWWKRGKLKWDDVGPLIPFCVLALLMGLMTSYMERNVVGAQGREWAYTFPQRLVIAGHALWFYIVKLLWPANLIFMYSKWDVSMPQQSWQLLFGAAIVATIVSLFTLRDRIGRGPVVAVLFFVGTLFPALGFINVFPMRYSFVADHFQYMACIGLIALIVATFARLVRIKEASIALAAVVLLTLGALTFSQARIYKDAPTLWVDTIRKNPDCWMARNNYGTLLLLTGKDDDALAQFREVLQLNPRHMEAMMNIGLIAERRDHLENAETDFLAAIKTCEHDQVHRTSCAEPWYNLGRLYTRLGKPEKAISAYEQALQWNPRHVKAMINLGVIYADRHQLEHAIELYTKALQLDPESTSGRNNLGNAFLQQGKINEALEQWGEVLRLDKNNANALNGIGLANVYLGNWDNAIAGFKLALQSNPDLVEAKRNLAAAERQKAAATRPTTAATTQSAARASELSPATQQTLP